MTVVEKGIDLHEPLCLPEIELISCLAERTGGGSAAYGATAIAAAYCGFKSAPSAIRGTWVHGWNPCYRKMLHPDLILGMRTKPEGYHWVARKDEEEFLRDCGYENFLAIGLPVVYLPPSEVRRRSGSLLVMPVHSLHFTTHSWKFDEYAEAIAAVRSEFTEVVVCIHPSCWKRGYWVDAFRDRGFPLVTGAVYVDRNALKRIQSLMSSFEYVTTNGFGSHLVYAAYFGAKPSIYGPFASYRAEDFKNDHLWMYHPKLLEPGLAAISEKALRQHCPQFFCHPREARADVEWARFEIGESNKVSPRRMRSLFGWDVRARVSRSLQSKTLERLKHRARIHLDPSYRETHRLLTLPPNQPASTTLLGPQLEFQDGHRFILKKQALFDQEVYRFVAAGDPPRVLDCGAGIGLGVCYFKKLYPESEITAFEPDPRVYEILKRNCESWGAQDVRLIPKAVWNRETTIAFVRHDETRGRIWEGATGDDVIQVQTCRLRDYLTQKVDLLQLSIEGSEVDVLLDCADLLGQVQNLIVTYYSIFERPQRLDTLMAALTKAGFRMHLHALSGSPSPLLWREIIGGSDGRLSIFAFRA